MCMNRAEMSLIDAGILRGRTHDHGAILLFSGLFCKYVSLYIVGRDTTIKKEVSENSLFFMLPEVANGVCLVRFEVRRM